MVTQLLVSVGAVTAISTLLAVFMVLADATIANYGDVKLKINDDKELVVKGGKPLLATLMLKKIFIPSACGGRGSCGLCKVQVTKGAGPYLPTELPWISAEEQQDNIRLACQVKVKNDFEIRIPEELFNVKQYRTRVLSLKDLTHDIKEVRLQLLEPDTIDLKAGQFVQFQVPEYELTEEAVYRAYSVSSAPKERNIVELEIRLVPGGICTTYVHNYLKEGEEVVINGPYGDFYLRESDARIVFIAGGSGMAPIKAILLDMQEKRIDRKATYIFGARTRKDLFLVDEMRQLEQELPDFSFVPVLSAPEPGDDWEGEKGLVTQMVEKQLQSGENVEAYLCGSPGMIDACKGVLEAKGVKTERIFYDKFS